MPEKFIMTTIRLPRDLLERLREKKGMFSMAAIIRRLIERYVNGEISLD